MCVCACVSLCVHVSAFLSAMYREGALKILRDAGAAGVPVGEALYISVMEACGRAGNKAMAISILKVRVSIHCTR